MTISFCGGAFQFNITKNSGGMNLKGFYHKGDKKLECETFINAKQTQIPFLGDKIEAFLSSLQNKIKPNHRYNDKKNLYLTVGSDLNHREKVIQSLAAPIFLIPNAPLLENALKESKFKIDDLQFWIELSHKNWPQEKIEILSGELCKLLNTTYPTGFLSPFFSSLVEHMDVKLLRFLIYMDVGLIYYPLFEGHDFIAWNIAKGKVKNLEPIFAFANKHPYLMNAIFLNLKNKLEYFVAEEKFETVEILLKKYDPYFLAESWYKDASLILSTIAIRTIFKTIIEGLIKFPDLSEVLKLPDFSRFNVPKELNEAYIGSLKIFDKPSQKKQFVHRPFSSGERAIQMRGRQAAYTLNRRKLHPPAFDYVSSLIDPVKYFYQRSLTLLSTYPQLEGQFLEENIVKDSKTLSIQTKKLSESSVTILATGLHVLTLFQFQGFYYLFDCNAGLYILTKPEVYHDFVSEIVNVWKGPHAADIDTILPFREVHEKYKGEFQLLYKMNQWSELVNEQGICLSFSLDFAEQVLKGLIKGKNSAEIVKEAMNSYQEFFIEDHHQKNVEELLDRSAFSKVLEQGEIFENYENVRAYLAFLIADANMCLVKGFKEKAIQCFEKAEQVLIKIEDDKIRQERKKQIEKGLALAKVLEKGVKLKPEPKDPPLKKVPPFKGAWQTPVLILPLNLKTAI